MKTTTFVIYGMFILLIVNACEKNEEELTTSIDKSTLIEGSWLLYRTFSDYASDTIPPDYSLKYIFKSDNTFIIEPISSGNRQTGTWAFFSGQDSLKTIAETTSEKHYYIHSITKEKLTLKEKLYLPDGQYVGDGGFDFNKL